MPLSVRIGLLIILLAVAGGLGLTARRAQQGRLRRSGLVGVKTPTAVIDDRRFDVANRTAVPFLYLGAGLALVMALLVVLARHPGIGGSFGVVLGGVLIGGTVLAGGLRGERAAKADLAANPGVRGPARRAGRPGGLPGGSPGRSPAGRSPVGPGPARRAGGRVSGRGGGPRRPSR